MFKFKYSSIILIALAITSCSKTFYQCRWQDSPVVIDGKLNDWDVPLQYFDSDTKLNYTISNDEKNLYVSIRVGDDEVQSKMLGGGFNLWLDVKGGKNKTLGIMYPLPIVLLINHRSSENQPGQKPDMVSRRHKLLEEQSQMMLTGFSNSLNGMSLLHNKEGIQVAMNYDSSGTLNYEAIIPFKTFYKETLSSSDTLKTWSVGMTVNGIEMKQGGGGDHHSGGGGSGGGMHGGGGHGGGGNGGGGHSGSSGQSAGANSYSESKEAWNKIHLNFIPAKGNN